MQRRHFLGFAGLAALGLRSPAAQLVPSGEAELPSWRTFQITTAVQVQRPRGLTRLWLPLPLSAGTAFQRTLSTAVTAPGGQYRLHQQPASSLALLAAVYPDGVPAQLTVTHRVRTRDWCVPLTSRPTPRPAPKNLEQFLLPTPYIPTDGIVRARALEITRGAGTDLEKAQAIYHWVVDNAYRNPGTRGCGTGDIRPMLAAGDFGGKCADLSALLVGLLRAVKIPARDVYGIRLGPSRLGYKSLGPSTGKITKAQHCRAELYLADHGWIPIDPADVRKVILEEPPGHLPPTSDKVTAARQRLFGSWEMNWMAYNHAQEVSLPGSPGAPVHFLMYPQAETSEGRLDSLDPESFSYEITSEELS